MRKIQYSMEEVEGMNTQGRKGMKLDRMNMAFSPANYDYIRVMSAIRGQSMTQFVNDIIMEDRQKNGKVYRMAKELAQEIE